VTPLQAAVLEEALSWERTPWRHMARVKGHGVDCAQYLAAVYEAAGAIGHLELGAYPRDWHLHRDRPRFLEELEKHAASVERPQPGDVAMYRFGRHAAHGAIVLDWPYIVHAYQPAGMVTRDDGDKGALGARLAGFWRMGALAKEAR
jgi:cell wall-associated NlpC family hydrolase